MTEASTRGGTSAPGRAPVRVGLLLPASNSVMEPDMWEALWPHASVHTSRLPLAAVTEKAERRMLEAAPTAAAGLALLRPELTVFGCTSAGGVLGRAAERELLEELAKHAGSTMLSVLGAAVEVLSDLGPQSVGVFSPYVPELSHAVAASLAAEGFTIEHVASLELTDNSEIGRLSRQDVIQAVIREMSDCGAESLFVSCTNLAALAAAPEIGRILQRPVVTSNSAVAQAVQQRLGVAATRGECA